MAGFSDGAETGTERPGIAAGYRPLPGAADEMIAPDGTVRPAWRGFLSALDRLDGRALAGRFARADRYLRDAGVYYRAYGAPGGSGAADIERSWPIAHIPVLIQEAEWTALSAGLVQRARLLEALMADLYGNNRLIAEGALPPALVGGNPDFLRPLVGVTPASGHFLHLVSFEIGRGPDGRWWVLSDRTQAPSGAGFALENRVATTRAFSDVYAESRVRRLAPFFSDLRDALTGLSGESGARVGVLTPGPANETYFEHAYIARYLGFSLLEGEDLTVVDGRVMVRSVEGLRPVDVLWRRLDGHYADPLELDPDSRIGTPGLVEAVRAGTVTLVNALGSGILETRALLAFLPGICRRLIGEDLALPSVATWWCGGAAERAHVAEHLAEMVVGPALSRLPFFDDQGRSLRGDVPGRAATEDRLAALDARGGDLVGQEAVTLSTTPAFVDGRLEPRPMSLRVFAARTRDGWTIMPGGYARIGSSGNASALAMQAGGKAADVWVMSEREVAPVTLLTPSPAPARREPGGLPSRAGDNLFWLGRYIERAEGALRILRAWHGRLAESADPDEPLLRRIGVYLAALDIDTAEAVPRMLVANIDSAVTSAGNIRDRFSPDGWLALTDLAKTARRFREEVAAGDDAAHAMTILLRKLAGFAGLIHENMYRITGWGFLSIGRQLERALHMTRLLGDLGAPGAPDGALDMLLETGDNVITHRRHYSVQASRDSVVALLGLDPLNPRSVIFQLNDIAQAVERLPEPQARGGAASLRETALSLRARLSTLRPDGFTPAFARSLEADLEGFSDRLTHLYLG